MIEQVVGYHKFVLIEFLIWNDFPAVQNESIRWLKSNNSGTYNISSKPDKYEFNDSHNHLNISNLSYSDRGNYTIVATNEAGSSMSSVELILKGKFKCISL